MKIKLLILFLFLLIPCIGKSQNGSTANKQFWFSESQVRKLYEVKVEFEFLQVENMNLSQMIDLCENMNLSVQESKAELQWQLDIRTSQYNNSQLIAGQEREKYQIADETMQSMKRKKNIFITSTIVASAAVLLVLALK